MIQPIKEDKFQKKNCFNGMLNDKSHDEYMSSFLPALMSMLINNEVNVEGKCSQAVLKIFALVTYNTRKLRKPSSHCLNHRHHNKERETSVTIYVVFKLCSTARSRTIIDYLFSLAICASYGRILTLTKSIYDVLHKSCALKSKCSIIFVKDNIDKNASANLIHSHYHVASISLLQFLECKSQEECLDGFGYIDTAQKSKKLSPLPSEYTNAEKVHLFSDEYFVPFCRYNYTDLSKF